MFFHNKLNIYILVTGFWFPVCLRAAEVSLIPRSATSSHVIGAGNSITLLPDSRVTLEVYLSDWDSGLTGDPQLKVWQVQIDSGGYTSGDNSEIKAAVQSCTLDIDCENAFGETGSSCNSGFCESGYQNTSHSDWIGASFASVDINIPNFRYGGIIDPPATDDGNPKYVGTLIIDVGSDARGTFTIGFTENQKENFLRDQDNILISPVTFFAAKITVSTSAPCCLPERTCDRIPPSRCIILGGTVVSDCLGDNNSNGLDDACEFVGCCRNDDTCTVELQSTCENTGGESVCDCVGDQDSSGLDDACDGCTTAATPIPDTADSPGGLACEGGSNNGLYCSICDGGSRAGSPCLIDIDCFGGGICTGEELLCPSGTCTGALPRPRNRYLSFQPNNPDSCSAIRIKLIDGPSECIGSVWWVGPPVEKLPKFPGVFLSKIVDAPLYRNWTESVIHAAGFQIIPSAKYEIRVIREGCDTTDCDQATPSFCSSPLYVSTAKWGDVKPLMFPFSSASQPDVNDVLAIVSTVFDNSTLVLPSADLLPVVPDGFLDAEDIFAGVNAWLGALYPGLSPCSTNTSTTALDVSNSITDNSSVGQAATTPTMICKLLGDPETWVPGSTIILETEIENVTDIKMYQSAVAIIPDNDIGECVGFPNTVCTVSNQDCNDGICDDGTEATCTVSPHTCPMDIQCKPVGCVGKATVHCTPGLSTLKNYCNLDQSIPCNTSDDCPKDAKPVFCIVNDDYVLSGGALFVGPEECDLQWTAVVGVNTVSPVVPSVNPPWNLAHYEIHIAPDAAYCRTFDIRIQPEDIENPPNEISKLELDVGSSLFIPNTKNSVICQITVVPDCNGNDIDDFEDIANGTSTDCNANNVPDECEIVVGTTVSPAKVFYCENIFSQCPDNCASLCTPVVCDFDCNKNGIPDKCDIFMASSGTCDPNIREDCLTDCQPPGKPGHGIPDVCEIDKNSSASGGPFYCNTKTDNCDPDCQNGGIGNGIPDVCDISNCSAEDQISCGDCNGDDIPNECETVDFQDCNADGKCNVVEIDNGDSLDCQPEGKPGHGIPDSCELETFFSEDCNNNTIPDKCEIHEGSELGLGGVCTGDPALCISCDGNGNLIPDKCECSKASEKGTCGNLFPESGGTHNVPDAKAAITIRWIDDTSPSIITLEELVGLLTINRGLRHFHDDDTFMVTEPCVFPPNFPSTSVNKTTLGHEVHMNISTMNLTNGTDTLSLCSSTKCGQESLGEAQGTCIDFPADSFFNLFIVINTVVNAETIELHNRTPLIIRSEILDFNWPGTSTTPIWEMEHSQGYPAVPLFDSDGHHRAYIVNAKFGSNASLTNICEASASSLVGTCVGGSRNNLSCIRSSGDCPDGGTCDGSLAGVANVVTFSVDDSTEAIASGNTNHVGLDSNADQKITVYMSSGANIGNSPDGTNIRIELLKGAGAFIDSKIRSISFGRDGTRAPEFPTANPVTYPVLYFSINNNSLDVDCVNDFNTEGDFNRAADLYIAKINKDFSDFDGTIAPACFGGGRKNCLLLDQSGIGLAPPVGAKANVTSIEISKTLNFSEDLVYLTFSGDSFVGSLSSTIFTYDGAENFDASYIHSRVYAQTMDLGLEVGDIIDALAVSDLPPLGVISPGDEVLFSLVEGTPTRPFGTQDIIYHSNLDMAQPTVFLTAEDIGLPVTAEIDAIDVGVMVINDCDNNRIDDKCEIISGAASDNNLSGVPDKCEPSGNRYLTIPMNNLAAINGNRQAIRIKMDILHVPDPPNEDSAPAPDFSGYNGKVRWLGPVGEYLEGLPEQGTFIASFLECDPYYADDWDELFTLFVAGAEIIPSSTYLLQMIDESSAIENESLYSDPIVLSTARWGDVTAPFNPPSMSTQPNINDVLALVGKWFDKLKPKKSFAQLQPNVADPRNKVNVNDVLQSVNAWLSAAYHYSGPCDCESIVTCTTNILCSPNDICPGGNECSTNGYCTISMDDCKRCTPP